MLFFLCRSTTCGWSKKHWGMYRPTSLWIWQRLCWVSLWSQMFEGWVGISCMSLLKLYAMHGSQLLCSFLWELLYFQNLIFEIHLYVLEWNCVCLKIYNHKLLFISEILRFTIFQWSALEYCLPKNGATKVVWGEEYVS